MYIGLPCIERQIINSAIRRTLYTKMSPPFSRCGTKVPLISLIPGCVASCGELDGKRVQSRAWMRWTRGPSDRQLTHVAKRSLSESIRTVRSRVITVQIIRDRWTPRLNRDLTIKIQRTRLHEAYSHTSMRSHLDRSFTIGRSSSNASFQSTDARSEPSIAINGFIQRLISNFVLLNVFFATRRTVRDQSSITPCILNQIACRLFPCVCNSFALPLNT